MDTSLLETVCFVPGEIQPPQYGRTVDTDTFYGPLSVDNNRVWLYLKHLCIYMLYKKSETKRR